MSTLATTPTNDVPTNDGASTLIRMYTTQWCGDCFRAKKVMQAMNTQFVEIDITTDEAAAELVLSINNGSQSVPTIIFPDGSVLTEPPTHILVQKLKALS